MPHRLAALAAAFLVALLATVWVAAGDTSPAKVQTSSAEGQVLAGRSAYPELDHDRVPMPSREPATAETIPVVNGTASNYGGTAGFGGEAVVALPGAMGGRYTGSIQGYATVCADRCVRLPVVDWCQCYWETDNRRVADISHAAWPLVTDKPLSAGLVKVRVILDDPHLAAVWNAT